MTENTQALKRERGTGSIFHNGSAVWWIKFYVRGIPKRESSHSSDLAVAKKLLKRRLAEVETKTYVMPTNVKIEELIADLFAEYRRERRKSLAYVEMRWRKHLQPVFARLRADDLTTEMVQRYSRMREEEGASGPTINRELAVLKRAYSLALRSLPPKVRTVPVMPMYKESDPRTGFLEDAAYVRLARECSKEGLWLRALLTVAYSFGFRSGELLSMRVRQIDLLSRAIRLEVGSTKNDEGRITPMTDEVFKLLTACVIGKQPDDYVFTRPRKGKPAGVRVCSFRKRWKKVCLQAGVPDLIFHDLRRSGVRNLRRLGVQESVVMKISGHKTRSVFERYNIIDEADLTEAARKLNEKQNSLGQSLGIVAPEMVKTATAPSLVPLPN
jgi:integrase